jgi:hypothetical protein
MESKINKIKESFFLTLDEYHKCYVYKNENPTIQEYNDCLNESKNKLEKLINELTNMIIYIENNIINLNNINTYYSSELDTQRNKKQKLIKLLENLNGAQDGSKELIDNTKELYNSQYYKNIELFIGILFVSLLLRTFFQK